MKEHQTKKKGPLVISCKNAQFNHYLGQTYKEFNPQMLASRGWKNRQSKGDFFVINAFRGVKFQFVFNHKHLVSLFIIADRLRQNWCPSDSTFWCPFCHCHGFVQPRTFSRVTDNQSGFVFLFIQNPALSLPEGIETFHDLGFSEAIVSAAEQAGLTRPTNIQVSVSKERKKKKLEEWTGFPDEKYHWLKLAVSHCFQALAAPDLLKGKNVLCAAETGT